MRGMINVLICIIFIDNACPIMMGHLYYGWTVHAYSIIIMRLPLSCSELPSQYNPQLTIFCGKLLFVNMCTLFMHSLNWLKRNQQYNSCSSLYTSRLS